MNFLPDTLLHPQTTYVGNAHLDKFCPIVKSFGTKGVIIVGESLAGTTQFQEFFTNLKYNNSALEIAVVTFGGKEPTVTDLEKILTQIRPHNAQWIVAMGGGSILDLGKAACALYHAPKPAAHYHNGGSIDFSGPALIACPSTAGTGSEANMVSVLTDPIANVKRSFRAPAMLPKAVILAPKLLESCPATVVAASGMDALTQAIESYMSTGATEYSSMLALQAAKLIGDNLYSGYQQAQAGCVQTDVGETLLTGSYIAGIAFASSRLGVVHGLAHPFGARFHVPHGLVCAICLPYALSFNKEAAEAQYETLSEYFQQDLIEFICKLNYKLGISNVLAGKEIEDSESFVQEILASGSTAANPRKVDEKSARQLISDIVDDAIINS
ncbi:MAG: iron-containing alcohol dehydrogenase family protein [Desulfovibrio sp.]